MTSITTHHNTNSSNGKFDLHQTITDKIIAAIEAGVKRDGKPLWSGAGSSGMPYNRTSCKSYSGVNVLILWLAAMENGFSSSAWLTYKQATALGGNIKKGSKGQQVVYYSTMERESTDHATGEINPRKVGLSE